MNSIEIKVDCDWMPNPDKVFKTLDHIALKYPLAPKKQAQSLEKATTFKISLKVCHRYGLGEKKTIELVAYCLS